MSTSAERPRPSSPALGPLVSLATAVLLVVILHEGRELLVPLALGMVLAFVLTPPVRALERLRMPRSLAVGITLVTAVGVLSAAMWFVVLEVGELLAEIGSFATEMQTKLADLSPDEGGTLDRVQRSISTVSAELEHTAGTAAPEVRVVTDPMSMASVRDVIAPIVGPVGGTLLVLVLVGFMLGNREDVRDRIIRLVGTRYVTLTTTAIDAALHGVVRYLYLYSAINAIIGVLIGIGLWWVGVPYPALWGALAAVLRFVPYIGIVIALVFPATLAFATTPGWGALLGTLALFGGLDFVFAYVIEPMFIGRRVGISALALLISAAFWTWVWGPLGLAIATPLTLCIAALGRNVPQLRFLAVVLGDAPALDPSVRHYQRLLAGDAAQAHAIIHAEAERVGTLRALDEVLVPTLVLAARAQELGEIDDGAASYVASHAVSWVTDAPAMAPEDGVARPWALVAIDEHAAALAMALHELAPGRVPDIIEGDLLAAEIVERLRLGAPEVVCVVSLSMRSRTQARQLCRRLRGQLHDAGRDTMLLLLQPTVRDRDTAALEERAIQAGFDAYAGSVAQAIAATRTRRSTSARATG